MSDPSPPDWRPGGHETVSEKNVSGKPVSDHVAETNRFEKTPFGTTRFGAKTFRGTYGLERKAAAIYEFQFLKKQVSTLSGLWDLRSVSHTVGQQP